MRANGTTYGVAPNEILRSMSGLAFLQAICDGTQPQPPMGKPLNFKMTEVAEGMTVFEGTPTGDFYNPFGAVHGGWSGTLLDSCMACAVHSTLEQGTGFTTVEFSINLVRAIAEDTGPVRAEGRVVHRGRRMATADGRLMDKNGKLLAHGTTTCMIMALPETSASR